MTLCLFQPALENDLCNKDFRDFSVRGLAAEIMAQLNVTWGNITVKQEIFACRIYSRISAVSRKFHAREYYRGLQQELSFQGNFTRTHFKAEKVLYPWICEIFFKFAKISCREIFPVLQYVNSLGTHHGGFVIVESVISERGLIL